MTRIQIKRWTGAYILGMVVSSFAFPGQAKLIGWAGFSIGGLAITIIVLRLALMDEAALKRKSIDGTMGLLVKVDRIQQLVILCGQMAAVIVAILAVTLPENQVATEVLAWLLVLISAVLGILSLNSYIGRIELEGSVKEDHGDDGPTAA